jgi:AcrR family transcriptional regulator
MGIEERKHRHQERLRAKILEVAEDLFVKEGFENVSMRKIATAIEYSPTTIYRFFENKSEIVGELIAEGYRRVREGYQEVLAREHDGAFDCLSAVIRGYVDFALENPNHYELWFATGELEVDGKDLVLHHGDLNFTVYQVWFDQIEKCQKEGLFPERDALDVFQLIWSVVHGLISLRIRHPKMPWMPMEQHLTELLDQIKERPD